MDADPLELFARPLEALGVEYMVTGGWAVAFWGRPRATLDLDLVLRLRGDEVTALASRLPAPEYYVPPLETLAVEANRPEGGHANLLHVASLARADLYFAGEDPLHAWALPRRVALEHRGAIVHVAPAEYVVLRKLQSLSAGGSARHAEDIGEILRHSPRPLDRDFIGHWANRLGVAERWDALCGG